MEKIFEQRLPFFKTLSPEEKRTFIQKSQFLEGEAGKVIIEAGALCRMVYFVLEGRLRVYKLSEDGREITLYRAAKGEACLFTLTCIMGEEGLDTITVVEDKAKLVGIPSEYFESLMGNNLEFQRYFLRRLLMKISNLVMLTEEITFFSIESRLAKYLLNLYEQEKTTTLSVTHEKIAFEIGTAREVVSRMLKVFQKQKILNMSRGKITLLSIKKLEKFLPL